MTRTVVTVTWKEGPNNPVIREQVIERAAGFRDAGFDARVEVALSAGDEVALNGDLGRVPIRVSRAGGFASLVRFTDAVMAGTPAVQGGRPVLVCRGALVAVAASLARRLRRRDWVILHDARGWYAAESANKREGLPRRVGKQVVERAAFRCADRSVVVSQALLGVALAYGADPKRVAVIPPHVAISAVQRSRQDGDRSAEVVYVGNSQHAYQSEGAIRRFLTALAAELPDVRIGWLDAMAPADRAEPLAANLWRRRVEPERVGSVLTQARVALVKRTMDGTNATAAPTKALQYLAAGCRLVTSPFPPSIADLARLTSGVVVSSDEITDWAAAVRQALESPGERQATDLGIVAQREWRLLLGAV